MKNKRQNLLLLGICIWIQQNVSINPFFKEIWLLYMDKKTKCVVFQNAKSSVTFDQYFT